MDAPSAVHFLKEITSLISAPKVDVKESWRCRKSFSFFPSPVADHVAQCFARHRGAEASQPGPRTLSGVQAPYFSANR